VVQGRISTMENDTLEASVDVNRLVAPRELFMSVSLIFNISITLVKKKLVPHEVTQDQKQQYYLIYNHLLLRTKMTLLDSIVTSDRK